MNKDIIKEMVVFIIACILFFTGCGIIIYTAAMMAL